ncbi:MAG TPA: hypothetical protein VD866_03850 [Urbifossiella sp.]|nr:hypothetical protein [Urbifossiella sp.]
MKRLAVLTLTAAVMWGGSAAWAADPLPLPTGFAPTAPRVPAPMLRNGAVVPATSAPAVGPVQTVGFRAPGSVPASDWTRGANVWCTDCAPAVRHPLPPAPVSCATGACAGGHDGSCWEKFKGWLCFRQTPIHLGLTPTPRITPQYTYFPCTEGAGYASGNCGPGGCSTGHPRLGGLVGGRGCTTCPTPGESVMPGFRFANPSVGGPAPHPVAAPASEVLQTGFRRPTQPSPAVPYRPASR